MPFVIDVLNTDKVFEPDLSGYYGGNWPLAYAELLPRKMRQSLNARAEPFKKLMQVEDPSDLSPILARYTDHEDPEMHNQRQWR